MNSKILMEHLLIALRDRERGCVLLDGPSGCGKTTFLRRLESESQRKVYLFSYRDVVDEILRTEAACERYLLEQSCVNCVICIENVDYLRGKEATQKYLAEMVRVTAEKHLVILTGYCLRTRTPMLLEICQPEALISATQE